jgi:amidase
VLTRLTLTRMAEMVRKREISPAELVEAHLQRISEVNPSLNAFTMVIEQPGQAHAPSVERGLLYGVPVTVKDSFDVAGFPTAVGSRQRIGHKAARDAAAVARLRTEGAIILGKTNTPEMLTSYESDNFITGRTNHPRDPDLTPGGSSGGEAAAIAAFCSPGGIGTDGGGSIRVPAHFCGIAGLKPTPGRISGTGHFPTLGYPAGICTVPGPMARTADDLRLLFSVLAGYDPEDPFSAPVPLRAPPLDGIRIGVWEQFYSVPVDPDVRAAVRVAAERLAGDGFPVDTFAPTGMERAPNVWAFLFSQWPAPTRRKMVEGRDEELHWTFRESLNDADPSGEQVAINLAMRDRMRASLIRQMETVNAILMPVCSIKAFPHRQRRFDIEGKEIGLFQAMMPAVLANVLGLPAVTVPISNAVGVQLLGRPYEDELLLELAVRLQAIQ